MKTLSSEMSYYQTREFSAELGGKVIRYVSKPGLLHWDQVTPAIHLLSEVVTLPPDAKAMLLGSNNGVLGVTLARQLHEGRLWLTDTNIIALSMTQKTLDINHITNACLYPEISVLPHFSDYFDAIILEMPKGRKLARRLLVEAHAALKVGGWVYLAGSNDQGIQSMLNDTRELFGNISILKYKKGNRAASAKKNSHLRENAEWAVEPGILPGTWYEFDLNIEGVTHYYIHSLPGIFSFDRLDSGTSLLLPMLTMARNASVLDVGCGYGIIGMVASHNGASHVDMIDVDNLAIASATRNLEYNQIPNANAFSSDALSTIEHRQYDLIVTNPPFHIGKAMDYAAAYTFIKHAHKILSTNGRLMVVANAFIRYDHLMLKHFRRVERIATDGRYHVLLAS